MNIHDKIFEQIKQAADNAESKEFPGLESVWSRVEDKLDNKVLSKQNRKWKQWAVAASVVAVVSLGYQVYKNETEPQTPAEKIYVVKATYLREIKQESPVVAAPANAASSVLRPDADAVLRNQANAQRSVARAEQQSIAPTAAPVAARQQGLYNLSAPSLPSAEANWGIAANKETAPDTAAIDEASDALFSRKRTKGFMAKGRVFRARIVTSVEDSVQNISAKPAAGIVPAQRKKKPLLIVDGSPLVAKSESEYDEKYEEIMQTVPTERDTTVYLMKPLYIIDGNEYSEESLFGPNPTCPYAPLNLQEEGMTAKIYVGKQALRRFGEKGRTGVIVITTKTGKPAQKRK